MEPIRDPVEVEKEMARWQVITFAEIYRALRAHPQWAHNLRKVFLTEDLLNLPLVFQKFVEERQVHKVLSYIYIGHFIRATVDISDFKHTYP